MESTLLAQASAEPMPDTETSSADEQLLAKLGIGATHGVRASAQRAVEASCMRIARRLRDDGVRVVGFVPSDDEVGVPALLVQMGLALCDLTGGTVAVVDANVRYPGLPAINEGRAPALASTVFSTRWLRGSLALLTPPHAERAGDVVPQLARALLECTELFGHVLVDLTGFELLGEHATAAACMDAVALVGRVGTSRDTDLAQLARLMPRGRFLGVLLVG